MVENLGCGARPIPGLCQDMNQHRRRQGKSLPDGKPVAIEEKPAQPKSPFAITGLYFFDPSIASISRDLHPSDRDELEIVDIHRRYMERGELEVVELGRGIAWLDMGTPDSLLAAANLIKAIDDRQGMKIACVEEIAWRQGWIDDEQVRTLAEAHPGSRYGVYLSDLIGEGR
jgi:glucose-1-phosphate thymidylyltransferase